MSFRVVDVDDPSSNMAPVDDEQDPNDNRGDLATFFPGAFGITDPQGIVQITMTPGVQPGDNYRVAATVTPTWLGRLLARQNDAQGTVEDVNAQVVPENQKITRMLTAWRHLWLEIDSMDTESFDLLTRLGGLEWNATFPLGVLANTPATGFSTIQVSDLGGLLFDMTHRYEGGLFVRTDTMAQSLIVRNTDTEIVLWGGVGNVTGVYCEIRDDDLSTPQLPLTTILDTNIRSAFQDAYVDPQELTVAENPDPIVAWDSNRGSLQLPLDYTFGTGTCAAKNQASEPGYWVRHVVFCYQPAPADDNDSDDFDNCAYSVNCLNPPYPTVPLDVLYNHSDPAILKGLTATDGSTATSWIFTETIRDTVQTIQFSARRWQIAAHEQRI